MDVVERDQASSALPQRPLGWRRISQTRLGVAGAVGVFAMISVALLAGVLAPHGFATVDMAARFQQPSLTHPFGTDEFGRDVLSRIIYGTRESLFVGIVSTALGALIGVAFGAVAGYVGGLIDDIIMRGADIILAFPSIVLAIALAALLGPNLINVTIIIGIIQIPGFARVTRASVLSLKAADFVVAIRTLGQSEVAILTRHILPNCVGPILVLASLAVPGSILTDAALNFLGLGLQPPTPSWGNMLASGVQYIFRAPSLSVFPGLAIIVAALAFNLLGDGLRDAFDPRGGH